MKLNCRLLFLIGYRGTGKSTVARTLAHRLGWAWIDTDDALEARHGRSIREIFADDGEAAFRDMEEQVLASVCELDRHVMATGGGAVVRETNRHRMRAHGKVVWLTADARTIWDRLRFDPTTEERRPDLSIGGIAEIEEMLARREPLYRECADWTITTSGRSTDDVVDLILKQLGGQ